jgi:hypothetical protein
MRWLVVLAVAWALLMTCAIRVQAQELPAPDFAGWGFGVGLSFTDSLRVDLVDPEDVSVDADGVLHVERFRNARARMLFESHHTFQWTSSVAVGPFIAVQPGEVNLLDAAGLGVLFELNRPVRNEDTGRLEPSAVSFNFGIGVMVEFAAHRLREGFADGLPVPSSAAPTVEREQAVFMAMTTFGF